MASKMKIKITANINITIPWQIKVLDLLPKVGRFQRLSKMDFLRHEPRSVDVAL